MFPYIHTDKPTIKGNNVLKFINIQSFKLIPSLKANVPAKITINNAKVIKIISLDDSIFSLF